MLKSMSSNVGMLQVPFPEPISLICNPLQNIRFFRQQWKSYCIATGLDEFPEEKKVAILYLIIGREAFLFITNNLVLTEEERKNSEQILTALENHYKPKINVLYERYIFNQAVQGENEDIDSFVNKLRRLANTCDFKEKNEEMIRDRFLVGLRNLLIQKELLADAEITLQRAITLAKYKEQTANNVKNLYYNFGTPKQTPFTTTETPVVERTLEIKLEKIDHVDPCMNPPTLTPVPERISLPTAEPFKPDPPEKRLKMDSISLESRKMDTIHDIATKEKGDISGEDLNKIVSSPEYNVGSFVILKEDYNNGGDPPIWKIDGSALIQKFLPFEHNGETLYKSTAVYNGWSVHAREQYYRVSVIIKSKQLNRKEFIVQFRKEFVELDNKITPSPASERKNGTLKKR